MKVYYKSIDIVKMIGALLVVCVHTGPLLSINENANTFLVQVLARWAVPFFFVASSYFFFKKIHFDQPFNTGINLNVLKKYCFHILKMYLFWTLIYFPIQLISWITGGFTIKSILIYIRNFLFTGSYYHLWFLPALLFGVIFVYFLVSKKKTDIFKYVFILYFIGMMINVYGDFLLGLPLIGKVVSIYLSLFSTARNGLFFAPIFVWLGYKIARKTKYEDAEISLFKSFVCFVVLLVEAFFIYRSGLMNDLTCMYLSIIPMVYYLFIALLSFKTKGKRDYLLSNGSTLLYVSHCLFTFVLSYVPIINEVSLLYFLATLLCSFIFIIFYLRFARKWSFLRSFI